MENQNLELDFDQTTEPAGIGRVCVSQACSYTKTAAAPTITDDCRSYAELEAEVGRLKQELDALLREAASRFSDGEPASTSGHAPGEEAEQDVAAETSSGAAMDPSRRPENLRVEDLMTRAVKVLKPEDPLSIADELMKVGRFRHVVVVTDDEVVGVISHRDIFHGALAWSLGQGRHAHDKALEMARAKEVMRTDVASVRPDADLAEAARLMREQTISCLPVIDSGRLVGIITEGDFLAMLGGER